jgi:hypothetical protein
MELFKNISSDIRGYDSYTESIIMSHVPHLELAVCVNKQTNIPSNSINDLYTVNVPQ